MSCQYVYDVFGSLPTASTTFGGTGGSPSSRRLFIATPWTGARRHVLLREICTHVPIGRMRTPRFLTKTSPSHSVSMKKPREGPRRLASRSLSLRHACCYQVCIHVSFSRQTFSSKNTVGVVGSVFLWSLLHLKVIISLGALLTSGFSWGLKHLFLLGNPGHVELKFKNSSDKQQLI